MKILIEGMSRNLGGMEAFIMTIYRNLDREKYCVDFLVYDKTIAFQEEILENGSRIYYVTPRSVNAAKSKKELQQLFQKGKYDVFWSNKTTISNINALKAAYSAQVSIRVLHSHASANMGTNFTAAMHRLNRRSAVKFATNILACSVAAAEWMFGKYAQKAEVLLNGIDLKKYAYSATREKDMRKKLGFAEEPIIGHIGRFSKEKNHSFIFAVFGEILKKQSDAILLLCGGGDLQEEFEETARRMKISDRVVFLGARNDVPDILQVMNAFLFPSLFEGYGIALIEAQAAGVPCFASRDVIPESVRVTEKMNFISLEKPPEYWAEEISAVLYEKKTSSIEALLDSDINLSKMMKRVKDILETESKDGY